MKYLFKPGDTKEFRTVVKETDQAIFHETLLHPVCSTFALARDIEWSSRLFFIEMKEDDEEGVGTLLEIEHRSPAFVGEELVIKATVARVVGNELICEIEVKTGSRLVAVGKTGQRMLKKEKLKQIFTKP
ncbi:MAG TPA: hotdog domain-containing protein [Cyclobacteriaceae bacterium]|nr:hotdog domain-containing protein [Cyclobacteriaceae bacterium]